MIAREVMSTSVKVVTPLTTLAEAASIMKLYDVGFLPVVDASNLSHLAGVLTDRDLVLRGLADRRSADLTVRLAMSNPPLVTARETTEVRELLRMMQRHQIRRIPIVSNDGMLTGVVSQGDLALRIGPSEPEAIEALLEHVSAPAWMTPLLNGAVQKPRGDHRG